MPDHSQFPNDDPFAAPPRVDPSPGYADASGPHSGAVAPVPYAPLSGPGGPKKGNALAVLVILGLTLVAIAAVAAAGYFVWQGVTSANGPGSSANGSGSSGDAADEKVWDEDWSEASREYPAELTDFDALTAVPGATFVSDYEMFQVGEHVAPGIYVAPHAASGDLDSDEYCRWTVSAEEDIFDGGYYVLGDGDGGSAMLLAPDGYWVRATAGCGTWQAIDPATAMTGATGTEVAAGSYFVGRDVLPGTYVSAEPVVEDYRCNVNVVEHFGFVGESNYGESHTGRGGRLVVEIEEGDLVASTNCPPLVLTDLEALLAAGAGAPSMSNGQWLVGLDVAAGTYQGPRDMEEGRSFCSASVWPDHRGGDHTDWLEDVFYGEHDEPEQLTVEVGQLIKIRGCGEWELVTP